MPREDARDALAYVPPPLIAAGVQATARVIGLGLALLAERSSRNSRDQQAVAEFRAYKFGKEGDDPEGKIDLKGVPVLTPADVKQACRAFDKVQKYTDEAAKIVNDRELKENKYLSATQYGTAVHQALKEIIVALNMNPTKNLNPYNLRAEISFAKTIEEVPYGKKDSIRIDVHEPHRPSTLCVYDIKTGNETRNIVSPARAAEFAMHTFEGGYTSLFVTEVRSRVRRNQPF